MVICSICATLSVRGPVDADIVRHLSLAKIAERQQLSVRSVRRHLKHLPQMLESETPSPTPSVYIGTVNYNFNLAVPLTEEIAEAEERDVQDGGQEELGSIVNEGGGG